MASYEYDEEEAPKVVPLDKVRIRHNEFPMVTLFEIYTGTLEAFER